MADALPTKQRKPPQLLEAPWRVPGGVLCIHPDTFIKTKLEPQRAKHRSFVYIIMRLKPGRSRGLLGSAGHLKEEVDSRRTARRASHPSNRDS